MRIAIITKKQPLAIDDDAPASRQALVSDQPLAVGENDKQGLEMQPSTVADGSTAQDGNLRFNNEDINRNICCMCFVAYEDVPTVDGAVWIPCPCGRWLHEDCAEGCVVDKDHVECYCLFVLTFYLPMYNGICKNVANSHVRVCI